MCVVSAVHEYYHQRPDLQRQFTAPLFADLTDILRRLDAIDKALGDRDCADPAKLAWMKDMEARLAALPQAPVAAPPTTGAIPTQDPRTMPEVTEGAFMFAGWLKARGEPVNVLNEDEVARAMKAFVDEYGLAPHRPGFEVVWRASLLSHVLQRITREAST